jgi:hypothetical protein
MGKMIRERIMPGKMPAPARTVAHSGSRATNWWARWKRLAHRAAEIQAHVLLFLLYGIVVTPMGLLRRVAVRDTSVPGWLKRPAPAPADVQTEAQLDARLREARQQF